MVTCVSLVLGTGNTRQISPGFCPQGAHSLGRVGSQLTTRTQWDKFPNRESTGADVADKTLRLQVGHKDTGILPTKGDIQIETF